MPDGNVTFISGDLAVAWLGSSDAVDSMGELIDVLRAEEYGPAVALAAAPGVDIGVHKATISTILQDVVAEGHSGVVARAEVAERLAGVLRGWLADGRVMVATSDKTLLSQLAHLELRNEAVERYERRGAGAWTYAATFQRS